MLTARLVTCVAVALLGGCASVPDDIRSPAAGPGFQEVRAAPGDHIGATVRWGGTVSEVSNLEDRTVIAVVARPLTRSGEPLADQRALGRFFAEVEGFLDPEEYRSGRRITVVGPFTGIRSAKIDQYLYDYPVIRVQKLYMWQEYVGRDPYPPGPYYRPYPYWHDPYWPHYRGFMHYPWYRW